LSEYIPKLDCSRSIPIQDFSRDFTIVIAHRGPAMGLWLTVEGCEAQLRLTDFNYDYVVVCNGNDDDKDLELLSIKKHLEASGKLLDWMNVEKPLSPPDARMLGSESADGKVVHFLDNHVIVAPNYFASAHSTFEKYNADTVHSLTRFYAGEQDHMEYKLKLTTNFWAESRMVPRATETEPYRIAAAGHGGFAVRRSTWERLNAYGPIGLFSGYSAEELTWDLKLALHDGLNYLDPNMIHHHWSGRRQYNRHYSDDYFRNLMISAFVIGGEKYLNLVYRNFEHTAKTGPIPIYDLYREAIQHSLPHKRQLDATRLRSLDEQLEYFREHSIPF
jgi:hypothetical protein